MSVNSGHHSSQSTGCLDSGRHTPRRPPRWWSYWQNGPQRRLRSTRLLAEQLETRITLSVSTLASFAAPAGLAPRAP